MPSRNQTYPSALSSTAAVQPDPSFVPASERIIPHIIQQDVPILPSMTATSPPSRRGHFRSVSHPFPASVSKRHHRSASKQDFVDSDDDDDDDVEVTYIPDLLSSSPRRKAPRSSPGEDLTTGKCMTCNSTVRWPRSLKVFRCTECLTVNDLEPYSSNDPAPQGNLAKDGKPVVSIPRRAIPLSVERTRSIIDSCISNYLRKLLEGPESRDFRTGNQLGKQLGVEKRSHSPSEVSGCLSVPRSTVVPHRRTSSTSSKPAKQDWTNGTSSHLSNANLLTPHGEGESSWMRNRKNSDAKNILLKGDRSLREVGRSDGTEAKDQASHRYIFKQLEEYIISSFKGCDSLNASFTTAQHLPTATRDDSPPKPKTEQNAIPSHEHPVVEPDAKTLLLGDLAENSTWWMNDGDPVNGLNHAHPKGKASHSSRAVNSRSPRINWIEVTQWYQLILTAGTSWVERWSAMNPVDVHDEEDNVIRKRWDSVDMSVIEREIMESRQHLHRTLLKATETLLKRPRRPLQRPEDVRFLLILLANPLMRSSSSSKFQSLASATSRDGRIPSHTNDVDPRKVPRNIKSSREQSGPPAHRSGGPGHHSGIVKRILGLLAHLPNDCHHYLVSWFSRFSAGQFEKIVDIIGSFVSYRLTRQHGRKRSESSRNEDNSLVPSFSSAAGNTAAELHAALNGRSASKPAKDNEGDKPVVYSDDWQVRVAARVMSLLFTANSTNVTRKPDGILGQEASSAARHPGTRRGQMIPISSFYNTLLDYSDLVADFEAWESKTSKFSFCQYPFFLSIWAKIHVLEHDARRQMEVKAREAFFNSILSRKAISQYLVLRVRRDCLVEDSLRSVSEVVGSSQEETKKGLRIEFVGEEGVDAGGLRKEWFLLLVREIFDPHHGLFLYDDDSQFCYFNPFCFESSEQFFLVGVLLGLAIYNSTILDVTLPPFAFKKLLTAAPPTNGPQTSTSRPTFKCTLDDLAEYRPALAKGLQALLDFEGDVSETFCYDFVVHVDRYGEVVSVPLCPGGEKRPVTNANRREFVDLYVHYMLDTAVIRQFEPFKRGFFTVCGGNALSLFRPEEIELLVRGSDESLDVTSLRAVATYDNWSHPRPETVPVIRWFWEFFENTSPQAQRKILSFITGSDRIPAMGVTSLSIRLACLGDDASRYPTARTCFNTLGLYRYPTREKFERMLSEAISNSEGFGLK